jgi:hypothetical protein
MLGPICFAVGGWLAIDVLAREIEALPTAVVGFIWRPDND